jgi:hypothetical protein
LRAAGKNMDWPHRDYGVKQIWKKEKKSVHTIKIVIVNEKNDD